MNYIPKKGDIVTISLNPQVGHEQKGRRPAIVVSNNDFHELTNFCIVCPITHTNRDFPLHIGNIKDLGCSKIDGYIMVEQLKSLDYKARKIKFVEEAPERLVDKVSAYINGCL